MHLKFTPAGKMIIVRTLSECIGFGKFTEGMVSHRRKLIHIDRFSAFLHQKFHTKKYRDRFGFGEEFGRFGIMPKFGLKLIGQRNGVLV